MPIASFSTERSARADDAAVAEAQQRFKEGLELADANHHEEARLKFQQAASVIKTSSVLFNLARSEQLTGRDYEAVDHFKEFLRVSVTDSKVTDAMRDRARQNITALSPRIGQIAIEAPPGSSITVDGKPVSDFTNDTVAVPPGKHNVEARHESRVKVVAVDCPAGETVKVTIVFPADVSGPPPEKTMHRTTAGTIIPAALGIAGVAALGVGIGFGLASQSAKDDENALRAAGPCFDTASLACRNLEATRARVDDRRDIATVGYVAGGIFLAGAIATWFMWPKKEVSPSSARFLVAPTTGGAALGVVGTF